MSRAGYGEAEPWVIRGRNLSATDLASMGELVEQNQSLGRLGLAVALCERQLYLPECWFEADYKQRREECQVPEGLTFKTKPQLATEILTDVIASGLFPAQPANDGSGCARIRMRKSNTP